MADYTIKLSSGQVHLVPDSTLDVKYSTSLIGDNYERYGHNMAQTLLQMLENYASPVAPEFNQYINYDSVTKAAQVAVTPLLGQLWYDSLNGILKVYNGDENGWDAITSIITGVSRDILPETTGVTDIGSAEFRWHNLYSKHLDVSTNVDDIPDGDGKPAISMNGIMTLRNTDSSLQDDDKIGKILPFDANSKADIGSSELPFNRIYTNSLRFGKTDSGGLRMITRNGTAYIIPSSELDDSPTPNVALGERDNPFDSVRSNDMYTDVILPNAGDSTNVYIKGHLLPFDADVYNLGSNGKRFNTAFANILNTNILTSPTLNGKKFINSDSSIVTTKSIRLSDGNSKMFFDVIGMSDEDEYGYMNNITSNHGGTFVLRSGGVFTQDLNANTSSTKYVADGVSAAEILCKTGGNYAKNPSLAMRVSKAGKTLAGVATTDKAQEAEWISEVSLSDTDINFSITDYTGSENNTVTMTPLKTTFTAPIHASEIVTNNDITINAANYKLIGGDLILANNKAYKIKAADPDAAALNVAKITSNDVLRLGDNITAIIKVKDNDVNNLKMVTSSSPTEITKPFHWLMLDKIYPVGTIYENATYSSNPSVLLDWSESSWVAFGEGRVVVGIGTFDDGNDALTFNAGEEGGEYNHVLSKNEMPSHSHKQILTTVESPSFGGIVLNENDNSVGSGTHSTKYEVFDGSINGTISGNTIVPGTGGKTVAEEISTGGDQPHNNIQPYVTVYRWKRIS